jgi:hypothetical protein
MEEVSKKLKRPGYFSTKTHKWKELRGFLTSREFFD